MAEEKIYGYKKVFGFILPVWFDERLLKLFVNFFLIMVVMAFVYLFFVGPGFENLKAATESYKVRSEQLVVLKESRAGLDDATGDLSESEITTIFRAMPLSYEPDKIVFGLRQIAEDTEVSIVSYVLPSGKLDVVLPEAGVGNAVAGSINFDTFQVKLTVSGSSNAILEFIKRVDKSLPVGNLSDLSLQELGKGIGVNMTTLQLQLVIDYYKPLSRRIDLTELKRMTPEELALVKELTSYSSPITESVIYSNVAAGGGVSEFATPSSGRLFGL